jgi:PEP-CTERM motif-containing protein
MVARRHIKMSKTLSWLIFVACLGATPGAFGAASYTSFAISDSFVATGADGSLRNNNYGGGGALAIAAAGLPNGEFQSVIKFDLAGARNFFDAQYGLGAWTIQSVSLQLSSSPHNNIIYNDVAPGAFGISLMSNSSWIEGTGNASSPATNGITFNSLQNSFISPSDQSLGIFNFPGGTSGANIYSLGLTSGLASDILGGADASLRLFAADSSVSYLFSSRAMSAALQPQLIITAVPEPGSLAVFTLGASLLLWRRRDSTFAPHPALSP